MAAQLDSSTCIVPALESVPAFPPVAGRLLVLLGKDDASLADLMECLRADVALPAKLLERANSAAYGVASRVDSVAQAVLLLGSSEVRKLSLALTTRAYLGRALEVEELRRCWHHTMACALLSETLARSCGFSPDRAYTAGLMHDVGRLGLLLAHPGPYAEMMRLSAARCLDLLEAERERFGIDHAEAGRWLTEQWGFPEEIRCVAGRHHDVPATSEFDLTTLVHISCRLADTLGYTVNPPIRTLSLNEIRQMLPLPARDLFQMTEEQLRSRVELSLQQHQSHPPAPPAAFASSLPVPQSSGQPKPNPLFANDAPPNAHPFQHHLLYVPLVLAVLILGALGVLAWQGSRYGIWLP